MILFLFIPNFHFLQYGGQILVTLIGEKVRCLFVAFYLSRFF